MENNYENILKNIQVTPVEATNKRQCSCCGKILPIEDFRITGKGYRKICIACERNEDGTSLKFKQFQSVELIDELKARGYRGKLEKVIVKTYKL